MVPEYKLVFVVVVTVRWILGLGVHLMAALIPFVPGPKRLQRYVNEFRGRLNIRDQDTL